LTLTLNSSLNSSLKRKSAPALASATLEGSQPAGARLIRLLEDRDPTGIEALKRIYPESGQAYVVGLTGPPGAGKSTLVNGLITQLRKRDKTVAVIAVDPTSPFSGGAILGDRVRMQQHATDDGVFIRSMATRGQLGGLSRSTFETTVVLDAMGYEVILIETIGVGQDELDIVDLANTTAVMSIPGMGDEVQSMKAGILEIGDLHIINKGDLPGADDVERRLHAMLETRKHCDGEWQPQVVRTVAERGDGIDRVLEIIFDHRRHLEAKGTLAEKVERRAHHFFLEILREGASERILRAAEQSPETQSMIENLRRRKIDPFTAANTLLERLRCEI
jgi:LAO/AO transport system kinase